MISKIDISVKGHKHTLIFGRPAAEEITRRLLNEKRLSGTNFNVLHVLIYSGLLNNAIYQDEDYPIWAEVYELSEDFHDEPDSMEQYNALYDVFENSRWGREVIDSLDKSQIKIQELTEKLHGEAKH